MQKITLSFGRYLLFQYSLVSRTLVVIRGALLYREMNNQIGRIIKHGYMEFMCCIKIVVNTIAYHLLFVSVN